MSIKILAISNLLVYFATLFINALGANGFFNGKGQAEVSAKYQTYITPNNFAFSIWGVIYSLLLITLFYFFFQQSDPAVGELIQMISGLFILSSFLNIAWIISFSYEKMIISTSFIVGMMLSLMTIIGHLQGNSTSFPNNLAALAFTLYASWVLIATIINFAILLIQKEWNRFGISDSIWTMMTLAFAILFVTSYTLFYQNALFPIALIWAFYGIYSSYQNKKIEADGSATIQKVLLAGIFIFIILVIYTFFINSFGIFPV